jgi:23S rRNA pseudouridine1911/1915/1917 synthase
VKRALTVLPAEAGATLAAFVAARLGMGEGAAAALVAGGGVHLDGRRVRDAGARVRGGERVVAYVVAAVPASLAFAVVYEDAWLLAVDKPAGLPVAATRQAAGALDERLRARHAGAVVMHRLDRAASGLVLVALAAEARAGMQAQLSAQAVVREYVAAVAGRLTPSAGRWTAPVAGKPAATQFRVTRAGDRASELALTLETGRTHQIRVHAAAAGHPVVGDDRHGGPPAARLLLHACRLALTHPHTGAPLVLEAPPPADYVAAVTTLRAG